MKTIETYNIYADNLPLLRIRLEGLNKKALKLGMAPITLTEGKAFVKKERVSREHTQDIEVERVYVPCTLEGQTPVLSGWSFVALLQHEDGGTIIRAVPGVSEGQLKGFRNRPTECDHCQVNRRRNDTFVVRHEETGELKQVGRNCLRDFLGHENPHALASMAELIMLAAEACQDGSEEDGFGGGSGGGSSAWSLPQFLALTIACIREHGWLSRTKARESGREGNATADYVVSDLCRMAGTKPIITKKEPGDRPEAERLVKLVEEYFEKANLDELNDYQHNLRVVVTSGYAPYRTSGIVASIVNFARRLETDALEAAALARGERKHVGTVGEYGVFHAKLIACNAVESDYGTVTYLNFRDADGNRIVWKASGKYEVHTFAMIEKLRAGEVTWAIDLASPKVGETYEVRGKVEEHKLDRRDGKTPETWLSRCTIGEIGYLAAFEIYATEEKAKKKAAKKAEREAAKNTPEAIAAREAKKVAAKAAREAKKAAKKASEGGEAAPAPMAVSA